MRNLHHKYENKITYIQIPSQKGIKAKNNFTASSANEADCKVQKSYIHTHMDT